MTSKPTVMRLGILFLPLLFFANLFAHSQDSAYQRIMSTKDDTSKVMQLYRYVKKNYRSDADQIRKLNQQIIKIAEKIKFPFGIGVVYMNLA